MNVDREALTSAVERFTRVREATLPEGSEDAFIAFYEFAQRELSRDSGMREVCRLIGSYFFWMGHDHPSGFVINCQLQRAFERSLFDAIAAIAHGSDAASLLAYAKELGSALDADYQRQLRESYSVRAWIAWLAKIISRPFR